MPSPQEETPNYEHIKALLRDLHITRNVSRPDDESNVKPANNVHPMHQHSASCKSTPIAQKLIVQQMSTVNGPRRATIEHCQFYIEDDDASDTNTSSLDISVSSTPHLFNKRTKATTLDPNYTIPSVVITDVNEPLDLLTSTQRRFSQLYSGLRRFSTSHTVGMSNKTKQKIYVNDQQHATDQNGYCGFCVV